MGTPAPDMAPTPKAQELYFASLPKTVGSEVAQCCRDVDGDAWNHGRMAPLSAMFSWMMIILESLQQKSGEHLGSWCGFCRSQFSHFKTDWGVAAHLARPAGCGCSAKGDDWKGVLHRARFQQESVGLSQLRYSQHQGLSNKALPAERQAWPFLCWSILARGRIFFRIISAAMSSMVCLFRHSWFYCSQNLLVVSHCIHIYPLGFVFFDFIFGRTSSTGCPKHPHFWRCPIHGSVAPAHPSY